MNQFPSALPFFFTQQPACEGAEILMSHHPEYRETVNRVIGHIVSAADADDRSASSIAFAVQAPWGAGKSTTLGYVREALEKSSNARSIKIVYFEASSWGGYADPRSALALAIANSLLEPGEIEEFAHQMSRPPTTSLGEGWEARSGFVLANAVTSSPRSSRLFEQRLMAHLRRPRSVGSDSDLRIVVVLVDDLDRCPLDFTSGLLQASCSWTQETMPRFFFGFASNREHLSDSMREFLPGGAQHPTQALQKYVQVWFDIPPFFPNSATAARFLADLLRSCPRSSQNGSPHHDLLHRLGRALESYDETNRDQSLGIADQQTFESLGDPDLRLLAPLVVTDTTTTPRELKERLNAVLTHYPETAIDQNSVKEAIIRAFWSEFWWKYLRPVLATAPDNRLESVETLVFETRRVVTHGKRLRGYWSLSDEQLNAISKAIAINSSPFLEQCDPRLAIYLTLEPEIQLDQLPGEIRSHPIQEPAKEYSEFVATDPQTGGKTNDGGDDEQRAGDWTPPADRRHHPGGAQQSDDALKLYLESEDAMRDGRPGSRERAVRALERLLALSRRDILGVKDFATVGNGAVNAENLGEEELADGLYQASMALAPNEWANIQNYVDFLLKRRDEGAYRKSELLIRRLEEESDYKPEKTLALRRRLEVARGLGDSAGIVAQVLENVRADPRAETLMANWRLLEEAEATEASILAARMVATNPETSDRERYAVLRVLADEMATSENGPMAIDIYRYLLRTGLCGLDITSESDLDAVRHNLATLLFPEYPRAALRLWRDIYDGNRADDAIRRSLAMALSHGHTAQDKADALVVMDGRRVTSPPPSVSQIPGSVFDGERWWEDLPVEVYRSSGDDWLW